MSAAPLFSASVMARMRALNEANLPHRADVYVPTTTRSSGGVVTTTYPTTPTVSQLPCRVAAQGGLSRDRVVAGAQATPATAYVVHLAAGSGVPATAKIRVTGAVPITAGAAVPFTLWLAAQGAEQVQASEAERKVLAVETPAIAGA